MKVGGHAAKPSSSNKKPWMFPRSKKFLGGKLIIVLLNPF